MKKLLPFLFAICFFIPHQALANRLWSSGIELQSVTSLMEWDTTTGSPTINTTTKHSGAASLNVNTAGTLANITHRFQADTINHVYMRIYLYISSAPLVATNIMEYGDGVFYGARLRLNADRTLNITDSAATVIGSTSSALNTGQWYMLEMDYDDTSVNNTTTGKIDGTQFATGNNASDVAGGGIVKIGTIDTATTENLYFDDIAVNDTGGSAQTAFPGSGSIVYLRPNAAGDNNNCSSGDYTNLDETPTPDDATTFCTLPTNGNAIRVNLDSSSTGGIGASDTITLVQAGIRESALTAALESWTLDIESQSSGTKVTSATITHNDVTWRTNGDTGVSGYQLTSYTDPQAGGAWTPSLLDSSQIGVIAVDATPDILISTLWLLVEYVPSAGGGGTVVRSPAEILQEENF